MKGAGADLRIAREARGESLQQAASALRIDPKHLDALERNDLAALPEGPFAKGWLRLYREHLGLPVGRDPRVAPRRLDPNRVPMWALRAAAGGAALLAVLTAVVQLFPRSSPSSQTTDLGPPDQHVAIHARRNAPIRVYVDGREVYAQTLAGGEDLTVDGHDRIEVHVEASEDVVLTYNAQRIEPQGRQDQPRRYVFVDDQGDGGS